MSHVTFGIAGHIDHGKTSLTRALTNIETDRLKEEQERQISIENGFAYIERPDGSRLAVIDVPGHEGFIRQMIAGVAGIDFVLICVAADEGVMPQTLEHVQILNLLHIEKALVVVTKSDLVDADWLELVGEEIREAFKGTFYHKVPIFNVDSLSGRGMDELMSAIETLACQIKGKQAAGPLRLPIDDVFTIKGHGTVVRGTVFNGMVRKDADYQLLPQDQSIRIKQMQVHHDEVNRAQAGQRAALNIANVTHQDVKRGDVLVTKGAFVPTLRVDVECTILDTISHPIKQRTPVVVHQGTTISKGRIILFDRNEIKTGAELFCQLELEEPLVVQKGDRFILRRPSPVETIGGGRILAAQAEKHRYGEETVQKLERLAEGTPEESILEALPSKPLLTQRELIGLTGLSQDQGEQLVSELIENGKLVWVTDQHLSGAELLQELMDKLISHLEDFHLENPLKVGMSKAAFRKLEAYPPAIIEKVTDLLSQSEKLFAKGPYIRLTDFQPGYPEKWEKRMSQAEALLKEQGIQTQPFAEIMAQTGIPDSYTNDLIHFLVETDRAVKFDENRLVDASVFKSYLNALQERFPTSFSVQDAKEILEGSRKHVLPFLEYLDQNKWTVRDGNDRRWLSRK